MNAKSFFLQQRIEEEHRRMRSQLVDAPLNPGFIPIQMKGGIGDQILSIDALEYLSERYPIAVWSERSEALSYFSKKVPIQKGRIPEFTWHLDMDSVAQFVLNDGYTGMMNELLTGLFLQQKSFFYAEPQISHLIGVHPKNKFLLTKMCEERGITARSSVLWSLGFVDTVTESSVPRVRAREAEKVITVHDGYDPHGAAFVQGQSTKQWDLASWDRLVWSLKLRYPDFEVIQLGAKETSRPILATSNLIGQTTLPEAFDILSRSALHIDTDSGLVHAATRLGVPCVVLFGPTPHSFYGHPSNINLYSQKSCLGGCFHLSTDWMRECPIGLESPVCMKDIDHHQVIEVIQDNFFHPSKDL
jgi:hypothetical protein